MSVEVHRLMRTECMAFFGGDGCSEFSLENSGTDIEKRDYGLAPCKLVFTPTSPPSCPTRGLKLIL